MKKLLVLVAILSVASIACDAFKDNYGGAESAPTSPIPATNIGTEPVGGSALSDYASDITVCEAIKDVTVTKGDEPDAVTSTTVSTLEEGSTASAKAEKIGAFTTKISISSDDKEVISFTLKQTGEAEFAVCSVSYEGMQVKSGEITVNRFNDGADEDLAKAVNAGGFKFEFVAEGEAPTAVKVMQDLAGAAEEEGIVEGTYFAQGLTEVAAEETSNEPKE